MCDPVCLEDGTTYERCEIEAWLKKNDTSPLTGKTLATKTIVPNLTLRSLCASWRRAHPDCEDDAVAVREVHGATVVADYRWPEL